MIDEDLRSFQERYKFNVRSLYKNKPPQQNMSFEFRGGGGINGQTNTIQNSTDLSSKGAINSLNHVNMNKGNTGLDNPNIKRESIYKGALIQHAKRRFSAYNISDFEW